MAKIFFSIGNKKVLKGRVMFPREFLPEDCPTRRLRELVGDNLRFHG
jgi:hypothetical protein